MTETTTRAPELAKLLDRLPKGDPDAKPAEERAEQPPEMILVSVPWCEVKHLIPKGVTTARLEFGKWAGPDMHLMEIPVHMRNERTGKEVVIQPKSCQFPGEAPIIHAGEALHITFTNWRFDV